MLNIREMLLGPLCNARHVNRYSSLPVNKYETVAEHSFYVAFYASAIATSIESEYGRDANLINWRVLTLSSLTHDIDECGTGDIIRTFKYFDTPLYNEIHRGATEVLSGIFLDMGLIELIPYWKSAKSDSLEGSIIMLSELCSMISYCMGEIRMGNQNVNELLTAVDNMLGHFGDRCLKYQCLSKYWMAVNRFLDQERKNDQNI